MKTVAFYTLGCKVNQYETQAMTELFLNEGYQVVDFSEPADIYVVNTCTVTNLGDRKSRQMLRRAKRRNPNAFLAVTGCYAQVAPKEVSKIDGIDLILGTDQRARIVELCEAGKQAMLVGDIMKVREFENMEISRYEERTRAFIKIEEGCDRFCSYCMIPFARGPVRSRPIESVVQEAERLIGHGYKEIILTGIHVASYGKDLKEVSLLDVIRAVHCLPGVERLRLSSVEPVFFTDDVIEAIARLPKVCRQFHLSLQSGCDATLSRMNRRYTTAEYAHAVQRLRAIMPEVAITTDVICGFPGETQEEFEATKAFLQTIGFAMIHVFPYSERKGTRAAQMEGSVPHPVREARAAEVSALAEAMRRDYMARFVGEESEIILEQSPQEGYMEGVTGTYIRVWVPHEGDHSKTVRVRLLSVQDGYMMGEIL